MALAHSPRIVTDGLVLCLDAGNTKSYPGSGTTWTDMSGNESHGQLNNGVGYNGSNGGALSFDGVNDIVETQTLSTQFLNTGLTLSIVLFYDYKTSNDNVISWGNAAFNGTFYSWELRLRGLSVAEFSPGIGPGGTGAPLRLSYDPPIDWNGRIVCIDVTYVANGLATMYENGVSRATIDYTGVGTSDVTHTVRIGRGTDTYFPGNIYNVKLYNRALTASEIQQNFNATRSRYGI